jgi:hypothetical protein
MPLIQSPKNNDLPKKQFSRGPQHLDREQLEYSAQTLFTYGVILFTALGVGASVAYMTFKQLQK